ncbi:Zc3h4 [Symbiodinium sp. KB8]|nr:Zc3h4 [Symbiodinium sp. KB8]
MMPGHSSKHNRGESEEEETAEYKSLGDVSPKALCRALAECLFHTQHRAHDLALRQLQLAQVNISLPMSGVGPEPGQLVAQTMPASEFRHISFGSTLLRIDLTSKAMGGSKKTTAAERQAKLLEEAKGEVNRRACLHRQLHKTKFCTYFLKGACHYGPQCAFAHSCTELQAMPDLRKTRMCKAFAEGKCTDPNCAFAHGEQELVSTGLFHKMSLCKWNEKGKCRNGSQCRFAHGLEELRDMKKAMTATAAAFAPPDVPAKSKPIEKVEPMKVTSAGAGLEPIATVAALAAAAAGSSLTTPPGLPTFKSSQQRTRTALRASAQAWPYQGKFQTDGDDSVPMITPDMFAFSQALAAQALAPGPMELSHFSVMLADMSSAHQSLVVLKSAATHSC